jgi:hypothetical protein
MAGTAEGASGRPTWWRRLLPALGLLLLAPVCAEYLYGYDDSTGNLAALLGGLVLFGPLYGGAALIIREVTRRTGRGWPTILLLGLGFGIVQAGLIDHSMFDPAYRDIDYWDELFAPTFVPALGLSAAAGLAFVTGHMVWSIAVPIAIVEALVPGQRTSPWLGKLGLGVTTAAFGLAAWVVLWWHLETEDFVPTAGQQIGAAVVVVALVVTAFTLRLRPRPPRERRTANPWLVGAVAFVVFAVPAPSDWLGFAIMVGRLAVLLALVVWWSGRSGWSPRHQLALAGGALLANVATAFATDPIGDVSTAAKLAHNVGAVLLVVALLAAASYRLRRSEAGQRSPATSPAA